MKVFSTVVATGLLVAHTSAEAVFDQACFWKCQDQERLQGLKPGELNCKFACTDYSSFQQMNTTVAAKEDNDDEDFLTEEEFMNRWGQYIVEVPVNHEERSLDEEMKLQSGILPFLTGLAGAVNSFAGAFQSITQAFASSYSKELQDMKLNRGFDKFKSKTKAFSGQGLPVKHVDAFMKDLGKRINIPTKYRSDFKGLVQWVKYFDDQTWTQSDFTFNKGKGGDATNFNFFSHKHEDGKKMDFVWLTCDQSFKLAPDLFVWVTRKSTMGGLFSSTKTKIEKKPAALSEEQLKFVSEYFLMLAYQELARFMNLTVPGKGKNPVPY